MRGTVYVVTDDGAGHRNIRRTVEEYGATSAEEYGAMSAEEFIGAAHASHSNEIRSGSRLEFGPIGEPWRKL